MIEMAVIGEDTYRRGFTGDTFNTAWNMSEITNAALDVGYATRVGTDAVSDRFVDMLRQDGIDTAHVDRDLCCQTDCKTQARYGGRCGHGFD